VNVSECNDYYQQNACAKYRLLRTMISQWSSNHRTSVFEGTGFGLFEA